MVMLKYKIYKVKNGDGGKVKKFFFEKPEDPTKLYISCFFFFFVFYMQALDKILSVLKIHMYVQFCSSR